MSYSVRLSRHAKRGIEGALRYSAKEYGPEGRQDYRLLVEQALNQLVHDPLSKVSRPRDDLLPGIRLLHLKFVKQNDKINRISHPRHMLAYRIVGRNVEVLAFLHDRMDIKARLSDAEE